jgi:hypothetical protein
MPFVTIPREKGENNASTWGNTRAHASDDITLDPPPIVRIKLKREKERERERDFRALAKCASTHAVKDGVSRFLEKQKGEAKRKATECDFRARA